MKTKKNWLRGLFHLTMGTAAVLLTGCCAEAPKEPFGAARILSEPAGADIVTFVDNVTLGTTPLDHVWETADGKAEYIQLVLTKPGHAGAVTSFWINPRHASKEKAAQEPQVITVNLQQAR